jgi:uncharacterized protein
LNGLKAQCGPAAEDICLTCGLCCNGVIFADVKLLPGEEAAPLLSLGVPLLRTGSKRKSSATATGGWKFTQPCAAHDGCRCRIYRSRPKYCREFECLLLKKLQQGASTQAHASRVIRAARRRAEKVRKILRALGDLDEATALADRFRRMAKRLERAELNEDSTALYSRLTVAFHELNLLLNEAFYPAPRK